MGTPGSHLNQFEKLHDENNILLRTIGGGHVVVAGASAGTSGNGSYNRDRDQDRDRDHSSRPASIGAAHAMMAGGQKRASNAFVHPSAIDNVNGGQNGVSIGNHYIVRQTAFHVEVESLSDDGVKSESRQSSI